MNNAKKKKRILKKGVQNFLCFILGAWFTWVGVTIDTIDLPFNEIKGYIVFTSIFTLITLLSFYLLCKYSNVFEDID